MNEHARNNHYFAAAKECRLSIYTFFIVAYRGLAVLERVELMILSKLLFCKSKSKRKGAGHRDIRLMPQSLRKLVDYHENS